MAEQIIEEQDQYMWITLAQCQAYPFPTGDNQKNKQHGYTLGCIREDGSNQTILSKMYDNEEKCIGDMNERIEYIMLNNIDIRESGRKLIHVE